METESQFLKTYQRLKVSTLCCALSGWPMVMWPQPWQPLTLCHLFIKIPAKGCVFSFLWVLINFWSILEYTTWFLLCLAWIGSLHSYWSFSLGCSAKFLPNVCQTVKDHVRGRSVCYKMSDILHGPFVLCAVCNVV